MRVTKCEIARKTPGSVGYRAVASGILQKSLCKTRHRQENEIYGILKSGWFIPVNVGLDMFLRGGSENYQRSARQGYRPDLFDLPIGPET